MYGPWPRLCAKNLELHDANCPPDVDKILRNISDLEKNEKYFEETSLSPLPAPPPPADPRQELPACYLGVSKGGFTGGFHARGKLGPLAISMGQALSGHATLFR